MVGEPDAGNPHVRFEEGGGPRGPVPTLLEPHLDGGASSATIVGMTSPTPRPRRSRAEIEAQLSRKEAEGLTYQQLSAQCGIPMSTLARWGMWIGRERRQRIAASQADARRFIEVTAPTEREPRSGIELIVGGTHRVAIERDFDEVTLRRLIEFLSC